MSRSPRESEGYCPASILGRSGLFRGLPEPSLGQLVAMSRLVELHRGELVFLAGDPCPGIFLVGSGAVRVYRTSPGGKEHLLHLIEEGQTFADTAPYRQVHQDWDGWARAGLVDIVTRMGYKREHVPLHAEHFRGWADLSRRLQDDSRRPITIGIGGYFNAPDAVIAQYREAVARGDGELLHPEVVLTGPT